MKTEQMIPGKKPTILLKSVGKETEVEVQYSLRGAREGKHSMNTTNLLSYLQEKYPGKSFRVLHPSTANNFNPRRLQGIWRVEEIISETLNKPLDAESFIVHTDNEPKGEQDDSASFNPPHRRRKFKSGNGTNTND